MTGACTHCGRTDLEVTVTFDKHDPVSIIRALTEAADPWALRVAAQAIASDPFIAERAAAAERAAKAGS